MVFPGNRDIAGSQNRDIAGSQVIHRNNTAMVRHCQEPDCSDKDQLSHKEYSASANIQLL